MPAEDPSSEGSRGKSAEPPVEPHQQSAQTYEAEASGRSGPANSDVPCNPYPDSDRHATQTVSAPVTGVVRGQAGNEAHEVAGLHQHETFLPADPGATRPGSQQQTIADADASHSQPLPSEYPQQQAQYAEAAPPASALGNGQPLQQSGTHSPQGFTHHAEASAFRQQAHGAYDNAVPQALPEAARAAQLAPQYGLPVSVPTPLHSVHIQPPGPKCYNRKNGAKSNPWEVVLSFRGLNIKLWNLVTGAKTFKYEEAGPHGFLGELAQSTATEQGSLEALNSWIKHRASTGENLPLPHDMLHAVQQWAKRLMNNEYASRFALEAVPEVLKKIAQAINDGQLGEPVPRPANLPSHMPGRSATHNLARNNGGRGSAARQHRAEMAAAKAGNFPKGTLRLFVPGFGLAYIPQPSQEPMSAEQAAEEVQKVDIPGLGMVSVLTPVSSGGLTVPPAAAQPMPMAPTVSYGDTSQLSTGQNAEWIQRIQDASRVAASAQDTLVTANGASSANPFTNMHAQPGFQSLGEAQAQAQAQGLASMSHAESQRQVAFSRARAALSPGHGPTGSALMLGPGDDSGANGPTVMKPQGLKRRRDEGHVDRQLALNQQVGGAPLRGMQIESLASSNDGLGEQSLASGMHSHGEAAAGMPPAQHMSQGVVGWGQMGGQGPMASMGGLWMAGHDPQMMAQQPTMPSQQQVVYMPAGSGMQYMQYAPKTSMPTQQQQVMPGQAAGEAGGYSLVLVPNMQPMGQQPLGPSPVPVQHPGTAWSQLPASALNALNQSGPTAEQMRAQQQNDTPKAARRMLPGMGDGEQHTRGPMQQVVLQSPFVDVPGGPTLSNSGATYMTAMGPMASTVSGPSLQQQLQSNEHSSMMGQQHSHQQQQLAGPIPTMESGVGQQGMSHLQQGMSHQQQMAQQMQAMSQGFSQSVFQSQKQVELDSERDPRQDRPFQLVKGPQPMQTVMKPQATRGSIHFGSLYGQSGSANPTDNSSLSSMMPNHISPAWDTGTGGQADARHGAHISSLVPEQQQQLLAAGGAGPTV